MITVGTGLTVFSSSAGGMEGKRGEREERAAEQAWRTRLRESNRRGEGPTAREAQGVLVRELGERREGRTNPFGRNESGFGFCGSLEQVGEGDAARA